MIQRNIIVLLAALAAAGATAAIATAAPDSDPAKKDTKSDAKDARRGAPSGGAPGSGDSFEITMRAGKGRLGIAVLQIGPELRAHFRAPGDRGVLVDEVKPDSPAAHAGVRAGDVIVEVDGDAIASADDVLGAIDDRKRGEAVAIAVIRGGQRQELRATLANEPGPTWRRIPPGRGAPGGPDADMRRWFQDMPAFGAFDPKAQRMLEDARKRIEELERRLERLERR